ncbi:MAG: hypothetical protein ACT4NX_06220 [Deltaproteobacteria bacterium]
MPIERTIKKLTLLALILFLSGAPGCATKEPAPSGDLGVQSKVTSPEDFPKEIARLEEAARLYSGAPQGGIHLELAMLHIHHKNPNPRYSRALEELESYIFLEADRGKSDQIQNWVSLLKELKRVREEGAAAKASLQQLSEENQRIRATLEELKKLDRQLENKRRNK